MAVNASMSPSLARLIVVGSRAAARAGRCRKRGDVVRLMPRRAVLRPNRGRVARVTQKIIPAATSVTRGFALFVTLGLVSAHVTGRETFEPVAGEARRYRYVGDAGYERTGGYGRGRVSRADPWSCSPKTMRTLGGFTA